MESHTAKTFAMQLGALIALYVSLTSSLILIFGLINLSFPDAAAYEWEMSAAQGAIRGSIAALIVFFPTYVLLTRYINSLRRKEKGTYLTLTKWIIYLSLLIGGGVLLGDLVTVINTFLNGEITTRFILKALAVLIVVGSAFYYYLLDAREHWNTREQTSVLIGAITTVVVIALIGYGFVNIESPREVREQRLDQRQISDFQDIQWRVEEFYRIHQTLPETIEEIYVGTPVPTAPETRDAYTYRVTEEGFELCATFADSSEESDYMATRPMLESPDVFIKNPYNWDHEAGTHCFSRIITPSE